MEELIIKKDDGSFAISEEAVSLYNQYLEWHLRFKNLEERLKSEAKEKGADTPFEATNGNLHLKYSIGKESEVLDNKKVAKFLQEAGVDSKSFYKKKEATRTVRISLIDDE